MPRQHARPPRQRWFAATAALVSCAFLTLAINPAASQPLPASAPVIAPTHAERLELPIARALPPASQFVNPQDAPAPSLFALRAPSGAPNVVIVLLDDFGFGQSSAFGGPIEMPNIARAAARGLRYNRFHTTAICSPTRVALLTGRNPHRANMGSLPDVSTSFPGYTGVTPLQMASLAEILRLNGYATAQFGKSHETPLWERAISGPFDRWPTHSGFEKFYGFMGGETDQFAPVIFDGTTLVERPSGLDYHFTEDMTDKAIEWARTVHTLTPERPLFLYYATGATHAPHHVPRQWIDKYKGRFAMGWDRLREQILARQKAMGVVPGNTRLTPRPAEIPAWDSLSPQARRLMERQMETYAGFAEHTDAQIGRVVQALEEMGELDNTLFFFILGDNGASAEGGPLGTPNERLAINGIIATADQMLDKIDTWGGPSTYPHYAVGWAWAGNAPFQWTKQVGSHFGGTRNGLIIDWPGHIRDLGGIRSQFHFVTDIAPTVLDAANVPAPAKVNGVIQAPMDGVSMSYSFSEPRARDRRTTQYFEIFGNRAIYHDGWVAAARHSVPWVVQAPSSIEQDKWELYHIDRDFSQAEDLAARHPEKLRELQDIFHAEALKNYVYPIDIRRAERMNPATAGRPDLPNGRRSMTLYPGIRNLHESSLVNLIGTHYRVTAEIDIEDGEGEGVIVASAGRFGGWALYMKRNRLHHEYNYFAQTRTNIASAPLPPGKHTVSYEFRPDSGARGAGGVATLSVDGRVVARAAIPRTVPFSFVGDDGLDVGMDGGTAVSDDYRQDDNAFRGRIRFVRFDLL